MADPCAEDEFLKGAAERRESWASAVAWLGGLDGEEFEHVARELTSPRLLDEAGGLGELRAGMPADISYLSDIETHAVGLDWEEVIMRTPQMFTVRIGLRRRPDGAWFVIGAEVWAAPMIEPANP